MIGQCTREDSNKKRHLDSSSEDDVLFDDYSWFGGNLLIATEEDDFQCIETQKHISPF